jgi:hypothetical protein
MKLQIVRIADRGVATQERLHLRALADTNLAYFIVFDTTYTNPNSISNLQRHAFWFPSQLVKAGDNVVLITGPGTPTQRRDPSGVTNHFFHWGLSNTVWNNTGDCAVLFEVASWQTSIFE